MTPTRTVSVCADARATSCKRIGAVEAVERIRTGGRCRGQVENIRRAYSAAQAAGEDHRKAVGAMKQALPGILWSGTFEARRSDAIVEHSGLLVADLDDLDTNTMVKARAALGADPHVFTVFLSPSGHGLKVVFRVPADAARHGDSFKAVAARLREVCGVEVDASGKDLARLCFVSLDPLAHLNTAAVELAVSVAESKPAPLVPAAPTVNAESLSVRQRIAGEVLGESEWTEGGKGFCRCPGADLHTQPNGRRDCQVFLDGAPTVHCVHGSCRAEVESANRRLRSAIGRAESPVPRLGSIERVADSWPDRKPLPDTMPPVTPLPLDALPKAMRPWISDCADRMQCSPDFLITSAMVAAGSVLGNRIGIAPKRRDIWVEVPIFWGAVVGRPGTMKSPALAAALAPITRLEAHAAEEFRQAAAEAEGEELVRDQLRKRESKRIGDIAAKNPDEAKRLAMQLVASADEEGPACRRYFTNDPTVPKVGELLRDNPTGLLLLRDELSGWFRALDSDGHEGDRSFFLEGWNGKNPYTVDRIERGTVRIPRHCLSVLGGIQPGPLGAIVRGAVKCGSGDDGLLQRFGLLVWPDKTGWVNVDRTPDKAARDSYISCFNLLDCLDPFAVGAEGMGDDGIPALRFDPAAQDYFDEWRANHERALRTGDEHPAFEAYLCKVPRTVATLALLHHLADRGRGAVPLRSLESALSLQSALATHARRLYAPALMGPAMAARELARHLERGDLDGSFTVREVYRRGWSNLDTSELARDGCLYLLDLGWLREASGAGNGRPSESFEAHPEILGKAPPGTDKTDKRGVLSVLSVRQTPAEEVLSVLAVPPPGLFENSTTPGKQPPTPPSATPSGPASESWPDESPITEPPGDLPKVDANGHVIEEGAI